MTTPAPTETIPLKSRVILWFMFFGICAGMGYPILNRYDPATVEGVGDSKHYAMIVKHGPVDVPDTHWRCRVLIPMLARPIYKVVNGRIDPWNPVSFSLLAVAAAISATTAMVLVLIGHHVAGSMPVGVIGALLFLVNFWVPNSHLSGMVDSGEACASVLFAWFLLQSRWWALIPVIIFGALAKETAVTLCGAFAVVWWFFQWRENKVGPRQFAWVAITIAAGYATMLSVRLWLRGSIILDYGSLPPREADGWAMFSRAFLDHQFWYAWVWLFPLAVWRVKQLPRPWLMASCAGAGVALAGGMYMVTTGGNITRPMFNMLGPALSVAAAMTLSELMVEKHDASDQ